ncbi:MAG TPA: glycosyltransferase [Candidatus Nanoarchaeia archaeon]|nr:glycosyltransferase [Candidatus Nanoarchaeia archaeon]
MISVIITAYKEPNTIRKAIESFLNQDFKEKYEIVVVCPDDETTSVVKKYKNVKLIKDNNKGKPAALNLAFSHCKKSDIFVLSDGDVYIGSNSLSELIKPFSDHDVGAVSGRPVSLNSRNNLYGYWSHLLTDVGAHETRMLLSRKNNFIVCSGYLMAIRNIIDSVPEESLSDDAVISNLIYAKGYTTAYCPKALVYVKYPDNFNDWIGQKKRSAGGYLQIKKFAYREDSMRSFVKESGGFFRAFKYSSNVKEFFWTVLLVFARLYLWLVIFVDLKIRRKPFGKVWKRIESTK